MSEYISASKTLYDMATGCALLRRAKKCMCEFGSNDCYNCTNYIGRYINADDRQLELFMWQAEHRAYKIRRKGRSYHFVWAALVAVNLFFGASSYRAEKAKENKLVGAIPMPGQLSTREGKTRYDIDAVLHKVSSCMNKKIDVNNDGLINCIDAAVLFYKYFPDKDNVRIIQNTNKATDMNHLFNSVKIGGAWLTIEPQAYWTNSNAYYKKLYSMQDVWKEKYNPDYDVDRTYMYERFAK